MTGGAVRVLAGTCYAVDTWAVANAASPVYSEGGKIIFTERTTVTTTYIIPVLVVQGTGNVTVVHSNGLHINDRMDVNHGVLNVASLFTATLTYQTGGVCTGVGDITVTTFYFHGGSWTGGATWWSTSTSTSSRRPRTPSRDRR